MKDYWKKELEKGRPLVFLAPMDGYTDSAYRQVVKKFAPHIYCVSEFYSADGLVHSKFLADSVLSHEKIENPLGIQIFGKTPEIFVEASKIIAKKKYNIDFIDINMGCPAKKVVKSGHGSGLLINVDLAFEIVRKINDASSLPISVKTRLSFDGRGNLIEFVKGLERVGASLVTVHGRTTKQAYSGVADFSQIYELKNHVKIPIICNGDIENYDDGLKKLKNLDGFMIGRASFGNPWCFIGMEHVMDESFVKLTGINPINFVDGKYCPTLAEILDCMDFHALKLVEVKGEKKGSLEIRKHLVQYLKGFAGVKKYRKELVTTESYENTKNIINEIRKDFKDYLDKRPSLGEME